MSDSEESEGAKAGDAGDAGEMLGPKPKAKRVRGRPTTTRTDSAKKRSKQEHDKKYRETHKRLEIWLDNEDFNKFKQIKEENHLVSNQTAVTFLIDILHRKWCKRSKHWDACPVKGNKNYSFISTLITKAVEARLKNPELMKAKVSMQPSDPRLIMPVLSTVTPEPTREIFEKKATRM